MRQLVFAGCLTVTALLALLFTKTAPVTKVEVTCKCTSSGDKPNEKPDNLISEDDSIVTKIGSQLYAPFIGAEYNLSDPTKYDYSDKLQATILMDIIFKNKTYGTFVEAGALDGEKYSNSLMLERNFSWSGVLVEADSRNFAKLLTKRRKSWMLPACIGTKTKTIQETFFRSYPGVDWAGRLLHPGVIPFIPQGDFADTPMTCYSLLHILRAANLDRLDLLILDLQGTETYVLEAFPWNEFKIEVVMVACFGCVDSKGNMMTTSEELYAKRYFLKFFMERKGYYEIAYISGSDIIYVHSSYKIPS